jgi:spermidine/putrescine transport system ATP-binding protein
MSDRIAIVNKGRIEQLGPVDEIYHRPRTRFVAEFIGQANLIPAQVVAREDDDAIVRLADEITLRVDGANLPPTTLMALVSFRPEKIHLVRNATPGENIFPAEVVDEVFRGQTDQLTIRSASGMEFTVVVANESRSQECFHKGDRLFCCLHPEDIVVVKDDE